MIEQINNELLKLQDELGKFDGAVTKITQATEMSNSLIASSKELQKSFGEHLDKIQNLFSDYMNKTYSNSEEKLAKIFNHFQDRIKQEEKSLEKFSQLTDESSNLTKEFLEKSKEENSNNVSKLIEETQKSINEHKDYVQYQISNVQTKINELIDTHKEKLESEQKVLDNYLELASSTAELSKFLKSVDFPSKLGEIKTQLDLLNTQYKSLEEKIAKTSDNTDIINTRTQKLLDDHTDQEIMIKVTKLETENKQPEILKTGNKVKSNVATIKFFIIMVFIILFLFVSAFAFVFFKFFPHFFEDLF